MDGEGIQVFGSNLQFCIVQNLISLCQGGAKNQQKLLQILVQFSESKFEKVLLEINKNLINLVEDFEVLNNHLRRFIGILQDVTDVNAKLVIIEQIRVYALADRRYVKLNMDQLLQVMRNEKTESQLKLVELLGDSVNKESVEKVLQCLSAILKNVFEQKQTQKLQDKLCDSILELIANLASNFKIENEGELKNILERVVERNFDGKPKTVRLIQKLLKLFFSSDTKNFSTPIIDFLESCFYYISTRGVLATLLSLCFVESPASS